MMVNMYDYDPDDNSEDHMMMIVMIINIIR